MVVAELLLKMGGSGLGPGAGVHTVKCRHSASMLSPPTAREVPESFSICSILLLLNSYYALVDAFMAYPSQF